MSYAVDKWQIGEITISRVVENQGDGLPPELMFYDLTAQRVTEIPWLQPHYADADGMLRLSIHAFVVESAGLRIVVDTCVGNDKNRKSEGFHHLNTPFLERMVDAGFAPETIDYVLCTHMHVDHVGWNTRWDGARWVPTFPNARYLFGRVEWEHCRQDAIDAGDVPAEMAAMLEPEAVVADSVLPVIEHGLADFVEMDHQITPEVSLIPTPGHSPGHVSVLIRSGGQTAIITGDVIHHPVQFVDPAIGATVDNDRSQAEATRRALITDNADQDVVVLGTHFNAPCGGRIVTTQEGWRFLPCADEAGGHAAQAAPAEPVGSR